MSSEFTIVKHKTQFYCDLLTPQKTLNQKNYKELWKKQKLSFDTKIIYSFFFWSFSLSWLSNWKKKKRKQTMVCTISSWHCCQCDPAVIVYQHYFHCVPASLFIVYGHHFSSCNGITFTRMRICSAGLDYLLFYSFDRASSTMSIDNTANLKMAKNLLMENDI